MCARMLEKRPTGLGGRAVPEMERSLGEALFGSSSKQEMRKGMRTCSERVCSNEGAVLELWCGSGVGEYSRDHGPVVGCISRGGFTVVVYNAPPPLPPPFRFVD